MTRTRSYRIAFSLAALIMSTLLVDAASLAQDGAGESGTPTVASPAADGSATLHITLRGCPDGIDPETDDLAAECTEPIDASEPAYAVWGTGDDRASIPDAPRRGDGTYVIEGIPAPESVGFKGLNPWVYDTWTMVGADGPGQRENDWFVRLDPGEEAEVIAYYFNLPEDESEQGATLDITVRECPEGVDPTTVADPSLECTGLGDLPEDATLTAAPNYVVDVGYAPRLDDGTYRAERLGAIDVYSSGFESPVFDSMLVLDADGNPIDPEAAEPPIVLEQGVTKQIFVYYYTAP